MLCTKLCSGAELSDGVPPPPPLLSRKYQTTNPMMTIASSRPTITAGAASVQVRPRLHR